MKLLTVILLAALLAGCVIHQSSTLSSNAANPNLYTISLEEGMLLRMTVVPFQPKEHKITECQIIDWSGICLIDGKPVFGTDWELPRNQLVQAELTIGVKTIKLDVSCMYDVAPTPQDFKVEKVEGAISFVAISPTVPVATKLNGLSLRIIQYEHGWPLRNLKMLNESLKAAGDGAVPSAEVNVPALYFHRYTLFSSEIIT